MCGYLSEYLSFVGSDTILVKQFSFIVETKYWYNHVWTRTVLIVAWLSSHVKDVGLQGSKLVTLTDQ